MPGFFAEGPWVSWPGIGALGSRPTTLCPRTAPQPAQTTRPLTMGLLVVRAPQILAALGTEDVAAPDRREGMTAAARTWDHRGSSSGELGVEVDTLLEPRILVHGWRAALLAEQVLDRADQPVELGVDLLAGAHALTSVRPSTRSFMPRLSNSNQLGFRAKLVAPLHLALQGVPEPRGRLNRVKEADEVGLGDGLLVHCGGRTVPASLVVAPGVAVPSAAFSAGGDTGGS